MDADAEWPADAEWLEGRVAVRDVPGDPAIVVSLFFASAAVPLAAGFEIGADRLVAEVAVPVALVVVADVACLTAGFGLDELTDVAGFRTMVVGPALARFSAKVSVLTGV